MRRATPAALALLALTLAGCETTAQKSARLERAAKQQAKTAAQNAPAWHGVPTDRQSTRVRVLTTSVLHSSEGDAVVLALRNVSATSLRDVPVEITVSDAKGARLYTNNVPGLATALVSAPLLRAHSTTVWIDDQIDAAGAPASVSAKIGEGAPTRATIPTLSVERAHLSDDGGGAVEGAVVNHSAAVQREVVLNALARRNGKIVAAGRALVAQAAGGGAPTHFQLYLIGDPAGARLELSASPKLSEPGDGA
ncbi:MAG TPA: hypothetical protein VFY36_10090 [Solirubrobacteraceae bacterium]|nr:hypothetical protein [Solirubrobacteraceae bacterium]